VCRRNIVVSLCLCAVAWANSVGAQELSEQAALARFEAESLALVALEAQVNIERADAQRARLISNPTVTYNREVAASTVDNFLLFQQTVPLNGRYGLLRQAGNAAVEAAAADSRYTGWLLRCDVRVAFYSLLLAQEREVRWQQGVKDFHEVGRILRERENAGEGSKFDRVRAERELAEAEAQLASAQVVRAQAQARLAAFFSSGTDSSSLVATGELPSAADLPPLQQVIEQALSRRGDRLALLRQTERYDYERRAALRQKVPDPTISGGLKRSRFQGISDNGYVITATLPVQLFNRGQVDAARAKAASERSVANSRALEQQIRAEVEGAYHTFEIRSRVAREYGRNLEITGRELAGISQSAYQEGEQNVLELLDSYRITVVSAVRTLELQAETRVAEIELERAAGGEVMP
jgi:outer membrane protein, heavy metal efflux system